MHSCPPRPAWPDSLPGLEALYEAGKLTATLSNGNTRLLVDLVRLHSSPLPSPQPCTCPDDYVTDTSHFETPTLRRRATPPRACRST